MTKQQHADGLMRKLKRLQDDYRAQRGQPFVHFFCPILWRDDDVPLCKGHIVNASFAHSPRRWTVQRKDVDNFYGACFESEFTLLTRARKITPYDALMDKTIVSKFQPRILLDGQPIDYYHANGEIPEHHSRVVFESDGRDVLFGLKLAPNEMRNITDGRWGIEIVKDLRLPALVSLLKAAYLTVFELIGYKYALGAEGYFVGRQMLGQFFTENTNRGPSAVLNRAREFFAPYANMVRPVVIPNPAVQGTLANGEMWLCGENVQTVWGVIVFIRAAETLHAVVMPILERPDAASQFHAFLSRNPEKLIITPARFEQTRWSIAKQSFTIDWPAAGFLKD